MVMSDTNTPVSRRRFCAGACRATSGVAAVSLFYACGGSSPILPMPTPTPPGAGGAGGSDAPSLLTKLSGTFAGSAVRVNTSGSPLDTVGGAVLVESTAGLFLVARTVANAFIAVEAVCTHEGCTITGTAGDIYVCPCHGSRYARDGRVVTGPARSSLRQYATSFANGVVTITL
jgi:cytochrome b6-f complex iron-sulfur subunit